MSSDFPAHWLLRELDDVGAWIGGGTPSKSNADFWRGGSIPWISPKDMKQSCIDKGVDYITSAALESSAAKLVPSNSILLVVRSGILAHSLPVAINSIPVAVNQDMKCLLPLGTWDVNFVRFYLMSRAQTILNDCSKSGTTVSSINMDELKRFPIPLAPLNEQKRVAAKLDVLLGRVDACRDRLQRVPSLLKRFRQSVLAVAASGKLTEDWRDKNKVTEDSWTPLCFENVVKQIKNGLSPKPAEQPPGRPILRINSVRPFVVSYDDIRYLRDCDEKTALTYGIQHGDLLFTRYNGSMEYVGVCAMVREPHTEAVVYPDKIIRVRVDESKILPAFLEAVANSPVLRRQIESAAKTTSGQTGISGQDLKSFKLLVPSLEEQSLIIERVSKLLAFADEVESSLTLAVKMIVQLAPSLLAKAFRGELVPQDPNDEPASELLARIHKDASEKPVKKEKALSRR